MFILDLRRLMYNNSYISIHWVLVNDRMICSTHMYYCISVYFLKQFLK